ncbi:hypothetical protein DL93DRAFT_2078537 [Clavulina sp. PMI_390]|nr:hypothetical protein DL93DRAFT_2078537 [Clavulina sp. PMI_390]
MGRINTTSVAISFARAAAIATLTVKGSRYIPRGLKWVFLFLVALNLRAFPFVWHYRVVVPWFSIIIKQQLIKRFRGRPALIKNLAKTSCVNRNPFDLAERLTLRAGIADCDYNGHLSNSSYAKTIDYCRLNAAARAYVPFIGLGGYLPIAGTYHMFLKEIPLNHKYEIITYLPAWEEHKWSYLGIAFVSWPKKSSKKSKAKPQATAEKAASELLKGVPAANGSESSTPSDSIVIVPPMAQASTSISADSSALPSGLVTPVPPALASASNATTPSPEMQEALAAVRLHIPEGATLHAVAVSQYCYKIGRITIPPRVALIASGFGDASIGRWDRLQAIRGSPGGDRKMKELLQGGWKDRETWGDFWDFTEFEGQARTAAKAMRELRTVMTALTGEGNMA